MAGFDCVRCIIAVVIGLLSFGSADYAHAGTEPVVLKRTAPWNVNFGDESCYIMGQFGEGRDMIATQMYFFQPGDAFELRLFGRAFTSAGPSVDVRTDFGPVANPVSSRAMMGSAGKIPMAIVGYRRLDDFDLTGDAIQFPAITPAQERGVAYLDVYAKYKRYRLETGPMDKVMAKVRECMDGLIRNWGYDPARIAQSAGAEPLTSPGTWVRSGDYPSAQLMRGGNALVQFRLDISETGDVKDCHLQKPMNPAEFN